MRAVELRADERLKFDGDDVTIKMVMIYIHVLIHEILHLKKLR